MTDDEAVQPLRIQKSSNSPSRSSISTKMSRPLSEISPMGIRRNSPSINQATKKAALSGDSSPFETSPPNNSPRHFWKDRESVSPRRFNGSENASNDAPKPQARRSSLEKLQKASRVKNSNIFARESFRQNETNSPSSTSRPLSVQHHGNAWGGIGTNAQLSPGKGHRRAETQTDIQIESPAKPPIEPEKTASPKGLNFSPYKSSLSSNSKYTFASKFNPEQGTGSEDEETMAASGSDTPRAGARSPTKTVSFDVAPPQMHEYEQITPDPSSVASGSRESSYDSSDSFDMDAAFERGSSEGRDDSFDESLEDTGKTPVVLPEDWRFMSPDAANTALAATFDDPFEGHEEDESTSADPSSLQVSEKLLSRSDSVNSDGERRPLPPLPGFSDSRSALEKNEPSSSQCESLKTGIKRSLPVPPRPASLSKADVVGMTWSAMPLEERLRRLEMQEQPKDGTQDEKAIAATEPAQWPLAADLPKQASEQTEESSEQATPARDESNVSQIGRMPPKISRESILRKLKSQHLDDEENEESFAASSPGQDGTFDEYADLNPDEPIPSREPSSTYEEQSQEVPVIKEEDDDDASVLDMYTQYESQDFSARSPRLDDYDVDTSVIHHDSQDKELGTGEHPEAQQPQQSNREHYELNEFTNPKPDSNHGLTSSLTCSGDEMPEGAKKGDDHRMSLPDFTSFGDDEDFSLDFKGFKSYMSPSPDEPTNRANKDAERDLCTDEQGNQRSQTPIEQLELPRVFSNDSLGEIGTPDSIIHHPVQPESPQADSPSVPGRVATVKASGGKLKTRPSATAAELEELNAELRHTSDEKPPPIPDQFKLQLDGDGPHAVGKDSHELTSEDVAPKRRQSVKMKLDVPLGGFSDELGLGLDQEFDRLLDAQKVELFPINSEKLFPPMTDGSSGAEVIAGQGFSPQSNDADVYARRQRGYLMRHNTKVVVANRNVSGESKDREQPTTEKPPTPARETKSAGNSPRKPSGPVFTTEPWNGKMRRRSTRRSSINPETGLPGGPMQSPQGHENSLETLTEDQSFITGDAASGADRGRFFVKVVGVKDLDLPLPRNERSWFQLTLDNGLHCVTTAWLELGKSAPIGQEFELTVFNELDFSLTLQTKLERPQSQASSMSSFSSPTKSSKAAKSSAISRLLTSPKKRRENEKKQQEEEALAARQRQQEIEAQRAKVEPTAWDLLHHLVGPDGSFARAVVSLDDHERKAFGRPYTVDVPCFNSWATEDGSSASSTRSKHGGVQRKPPYKIGKLELQLLYIPRPVGVKGEDMPPSMAACVKQLREAEATVARHHEGWLSQQGADCPHWRRRYFQLNGTNLSAYHELTRRRRFNLNLSKVRKLVDDGSSLKQPGSKIRRKSAFGEDDEGYMFLPEGFRIQFHDGTYVDFYADDVQQKEQWMHVLSEAIGRDSGQSRASWTSVVLAKERDAAKQAASKAARRQSLPQPQHRVASKSAPTTPAKAARPQSTAYEKPPPPISKFPQKRDQKTPASRQSKQGANNERRQNVRSMVF